MLEVYDVVWKDGSRYLDTKTTHFLSNFYNLYKLVFTILSITRDRRMEKFLITSVLDLLNT